MLLERNSVFCFFQEHEERIMFLRERHELEQKIGTLQDMLERSGDEEQVFITFHGKLYKF